MPLNIQKLDKILHFVQKPGRYIGCEINIIKKKFLKNKLKIALCYPDLYEIGMSNFSLKILYEIINSSENLLAERVFLPDVDMQKIMIENDIELFTLETYHFIREFDILGITVQSELNYLSIPQVLRLSKIPLFSKERKDFPLVIVGGPGIVNPLPISKFIDFFVIGETDDIIVELMEKILDLKLKGMTRNEILKEINRIEYTFVPLLKNSKTVVKHSVKDLNKIRHPVKPPVPYISVIHNRGIIEVSRGCVQGCRFCQAGYFYRPYRERDVDEIIKIVETLYHNTGYDIFTLLSLNIADYSRLEELLTILNNKFAKYKVSFSLPSLRIQKFTLNLLDSIKCIRKSGLTFALETADESLQKSINKHINIEKFIQTIITVAQKGWKRIKIYLIYGFKEDDSEVYSLKNLIDKIIQKLKEKNLFLRISLHLNPLYKKPLTPLEKEPQISFKEIEKKINLIKEIFYAKKYKKWIEIKWQNINVAFIAMILSRGDERLSDIIYTVFNKKSVIESDEAAFDLNMWLEAFKNANIDFSEFIYKKNDNLINFIDYGYTKEFFNLEYKKYIEGEITHNCVTNNCYHCGVCKNELKNILAKPSFSKQDEVVKSEEYGYKIYFRYKLRFSKTGIMKYISHRDILNFFRCVFRILEIPLVYSQGYNPRPKIRIAFPLPLMVEGINEIMEIFTYRRINSEKIKEEINNLLNNPNLKIVDIDEIPLKLKPLNYYIKFSEYIIETEDLQIQEIFRNNRHFEFIENNQFKLTLEKDTSVLKYIEKTVTDRFPELWHRISKITRINLN